MSINLRHLKNLPYKFRTYDELIIGLAKILNISVSPHARKDKFKEQYAAAFVQVILYKHLSRIHQRQTLELIQTLDGRTRGLLTARIAHAIAVPSHHLWSFKSANLKKLFADNKEIIQFLDDTSKAGSIGEDIATKVLKKSARRLKAINVFMFIMQKFSEWENINIQEELKRRGVIVN